MNTPASIRTIETIADQIRAILGDDFDDDTFFDTLDGETNIGDMIESLILKRSEATANEAAAKQVASEFMERASRMAAQHKSVNKALAAILDAMGEKKVSHHLATISRTKPRDVLVITDESEIPTQLCVVTSRPDRTAIKNALSAGEVVPGAMLEKSDPGLTVRIK